MTRERLIEIMNDEINASEFRVTSDVLGRSADAILAEMAGEWNAGLEAAAKLVEQAHDLEVETPLQTKVDAAFNARGPRASMAIRCYDSGRVIIDAIRALRRPDAAPPRTATPSVEEVAHTLFMADTGRANSLRLAADGYYRKLALAVLALFAKERS